MAASSPSFQEGTGLLVPADEGPAPLTVFSDLAAAAKAQRTWSRQEPGRSAQLVHPPPKGPLGQLWALNQPSHGALQWDRHRREQRALLSGGL